MKSLVFRSRRPRCSVAPALPLSGAQPNVRAAMGDEMKPLNVLLIAGLIAVAGAPAEASAQRAHPKDTARASAIPADARPPKGMCRIWLDGVPAAQQPAATDCPTAIRNRPNNGRVIFGDDVDSLKTKNGEKTKMPPNIKGFNGVKPAKIVLPKRPPGS